jgi:murein DD-endopeptidase MepM/ murein hydrolase activator NlpD
MRPTPLLPLLAPLVLGGCLDREPPTLSLSPLEPDRPQRGPLEILGEVADPSGLASITLSVDGGAPTSLPVAGPLTYTIDTTALPDGAHLVEVVATDDSALGNRATAALAFATDNSPPALEIAQRSLQGAQGGVLAVFVRTGEVLHEPKVRFLDREHPLYAVSATLYRALIGVSVKQDPGALPLTVEATDALGNVGRGTVDVAISETEFVRGGYVKLSKKQQETQKDDSKQQHDRDKREAAWAHVEPRQLWGGPFLRPTEGPISSQFGKYREYSSGVKSHHLGLDLSNEPGTPVYATSDGEVLLAELLFIMGNHVILSHGQGVASAYSHLTDIAVRAGERVHKGQLIGTMGSTGQSTGPHLHWEVVVSGEKISPEQWEQEAFELPEDAGFVPVEVAAAEETAEPEAEADPQAEAEADPDPALED